MNWSEVVKGLKEGKKYRNLRWEEKEQYIEAEKDSGLIVLRNQSPACFFSSDFYEGLWELYNEHTDEKYKFLNKSYTQRGFYIFYFKDRGGEECSLQESSNAEENQVWLGLNGDEPKKHPVFGDSLGMRMLLDQERALELGKKLVEFGETGDLT